MIIRFLQHVVGFLAAVASVGQMFTGVFMCKVIYHNKSTKRIPLLPFVAGFTISILLLEQARIMGNSTMALTNVIGIVLHIGYLTFYYVYSKKDVQEALLMKVLKGMALAGLLILYANLEDRTKVESRYGTIVSVILLATMAAPLIRLPEIVDKQSTKGLPYPMIISGFVVSCLWLVYSILIWNKLLFVQNAAGALICGFQLYLFHIYPEKPVFKQIKSK